MAAYWQRGESIDYTNAGTALIQSGDVVPLSERIGVAGCDIPVGIKGSVHVTGVFIMPKAAGALTVGEPVFWDSDNSNVSADDTGNIPAGWVVEPAEAADAEAKVKIG